MDGIDYSQIDLLVLDVDGVMTDGRIILTPSGQEVKAFHVRDGSGMKYWRRAGKKIAMISGRNSQAVALRAGELEVDALRLGAKTKLPAYLEVLDELKIPADRVAVMGDDLPDLPLMLDCAFPVAVADAAEEVKQAAAYVTSAPGGAGCVREVIELILKRAGLWETITARYYAQRKPSQ